MKPSLQYIKQKFEEYNRDMFGGQLPELPMEIVNVKTYLGLCSYKKRFAENGKEEYYNFKLSFNERLEVSEEEVQDTLIHEMIHYFIGYKQLDDVSAHGPVVLSRMNIINTKFNRHISVAHKTTSKEREQLVETRRIWHIIATIEVNDGSFGVKVLPRVIDSVIEFVDKLKSDSNINSIDLFMTDEPYFNRYPTSKTTKFQIVDKVEILRNLKGAHRLKIHNGDLFEV